MALLILIVRHYNTASRQAPALKDKPPHKSMKRRLLNYLQHRSSVFPRCPEYYFDNFLAAAGNLYTSYAVFISHVLTLRHKILGKYMYLDYFFQTEFDEEMRQQGSESPFFIISGLNYLMLQKLLFGKREHYTFIREVCNPQLIILDDLGTKLYSS